MVGKAAFPLRRLANQIKASQVIVARNLEMLLLAASARRRFAPQAALIYECLDIHRLMLAGNGVGAALRWIERRLLAQSQGLVVSSPGFIREYFVKQHPRLPPALVIENKVLAPETASPSSTGNAPPGPPWRIGWFGTIRCRRSFDILANAVQSMAGQIEVVLAGRFASGLFDDVAFDLPSGLSYLGPYAGEAAAARLYRSVHFAWAIDFYEAGQNSDWLLPNRLYRAALYGAVPLAMAHVETGNWLARHGAGLLLQEPLQHTVRDTMAGMTWDRYAAARAALARIPIEALVTSDTECRQVVARLEALSAMSAGAGEPREIMVPPA
jgi:hypothetical protein